MIFHLVEFSNVTFFYFILYPNDYELQAILIWLNFTTDFASLCYPHQYTITYQK